MRCVPQIYIIGLLLVSFLIWSSQFEIDEAVRAQGRIVPKGRVQVVQVADGGILAELLVREGERVIQGQALARLEDTRASARRDELDARLAGLEVARIRAVAEAEGVIPDFSTQPAQWFPVIRSQQQLFDERQQRQESLLTSLERSVSIDQQEFNLLSKMKRSGDTSDLRLLQAEKDLIDKQQSLVDARLRFKAEAMREVTDIDSELYSLRYTLRERENVVEKTLIVAPKSGIVTNIRYATLGATISSGNELLSISPTEEELQFEVHIQPVDVGSIREGMQIKANLSAFDSAIYGVVKGTLILISADSVTERAGDGDKTYYKAVALADWSSNSKIDPRLLRPSMTATIDIKTGSRTVLTYLLKPLLRGLSGTFIER